MACNPRDFITTDFSQTDDFERLVLLDEVSEQKYDEVKRAHNGKILIPYINMPVEGSFSEFKQKIRQSRRVLDINYTRNQAQTIMATALTKVSAEAYISCLNSERLRVDLSDSAIYDDDVTITVTWRSNQGEDGELSQGPIVDGGTLSDDSYPKLLHHGGSSFFRIKRNLDEALVFDVSFNQYPINVSLPPRPKWRLATRQETFPLDGGFYTEHSDSGNGFGPHTTSYEMVAPDGSEFVIGSARPLFEGFNVYDLRVKEQDEKRIIIEAFANTGTKRYGAYVKGRVSVLLLERVPIEEQLEHMRQSS